MLVSALAYICTNGDEAGDDSLQPLLEPSSSLILVLSLWIMSLNPGSCQHNNRPAPTTSTVDLCLNLLLITSSQSAMKLEMIVCSLTWSHGTL